jgi:hypothetical protein
MSTFEEKYRKKTATGQPTAETEALPAPPASGAMELLQEAAKDEYKSFNASAHPETDLWVRVSDANGNSDVALPYSYRTHMIYDGGGFMISMQFNTPVISVTLHGRNLHDLFRKLLKREVEWVMEFDATKWDALAGDAPCITGIEIKRKPLAEKEEEGGTLPGEKTPRSKEEMH